MKTKKTLVLIVTLLMSAVFISQFVFADDSFEKNAFMQTEEEKWIGIDTYDTNPVPEMLDSQYHKEIIQMEKEGFIDIREFSESLYGVEKPKTEIDDEKTLCIYYTYDFQVKDIEDPEMFVKYAIEALDKQEIDPNIFYAIDEARTEKESDRSIMFVYQDADENVFATKTYTKEASCFTVGISVEDKTLFQQKSRIRENQEKQDNED